MPVKKALLVLEDGAYWEGVNFGAGGETMAEIVFNTSMTGYQEILTDPSYKGQMVLMTYPLIGNYGINDIDVESDRVQASGFIVKELSAAASNHRSLENLENYLKRYGVMGIEGVDTRAIVLHIRSKGAMNAIISTNDTSVDSLVEKVRLAPKMLGADYVKVVSTDTVYNYKPRLYSPENTIEKPRYKIVAFDFGIKKNIPELMAKEGMDVVVVPATTKADEIESLNPDGVFLSNGPGDPAALSYIVDEIKKLFGKFSLFGICLGHQLLGLAVGAKTFKLKFGHRGANHPVKNMKTGKIEITVQNHGFAVDPESLPSTCEITHWNLNDNTLEGFRHKEIPMFCVQYHPEASAGPHDSEYLFNIFRELIDEKKKSLN